MEQAYFQDEIYEVVRELMQFPEEKEILFAALNTLNRTINYFEIDESRISPNSDVFNRILDNFKRLLKEDQNSEGFSSFLKLFDDHVIESIGKDFLDNIETLSVSRLHYIFFRLYSTFPVNPGLYIDGVLKKEISNFKKKNIKVLYIYLDLRPDYKQNQKKWKFQHFPPIKATFFLEDEKRKKIKTRRYLSQEGQEHNLFAKDSFRYFWEYLSPILTARKTKKGLEYIGDEDETTKTRFLPPSEQDLSDYKKVIFIPVYDSWVNKNSCGVYLGSITLFPFETDKLREQYLKPGLIDKIVFWTGAKLAPVIFASRQHIIQKLKIKYENDFLQDFFSKVAHIQEWEQIMVFNISHKKLYRAYCYRYQCGLSGIKYVSRWDLCNGIDCGKCKIIIGELKKKLNQSIEDFFDCPSSQKFRKSKEKRYFYYIKAEQFLDKRIIPSLTENDIVSAKDYIVCVEFPSHTLFPENISDGAGIDIKALGQYKINQWFSSLDMILLKIQAISRDKIDFSHAMNTKLASTSSIIDQCKTELEKLRDAISKDTDMTVSVGEKVTSILEKAVLAGKMMKLTSVNNEAFLRYAILRNKGAYQTGRLKAVSVKRYKKGHIPFHAILADSISNALTYYFYRACKEDYSNIHFLEHSNAIFGDNRQKKNNCYEIWIKVLVKISHRHHESNPDYKYSLIKEFIDTKLNDDDEIGLEIRLPDFNGLKCIEDFIIIECGDNLEIMPNILTMWMEEILNNAIRYSIPQTGKKGKNAFISIECKIISDSKLFFCVTNGYLNEKINQKGRGSSFIKNVAKFFSPENDISIGKSPGSTYEIKINKGIQGD